MNLLKIAIYKGFKANIPDFNYRDNWFGASTYHPDIWLSKGNSEILLSLGGIEAGNDKDCIIPELLSLNKDGTHSLNARLIKLTKNSTVFYKSVTGIMPDEQTIINFFKS